MHYFIDIPEVQQAIEEIVASGTPVITVNTDITSTGKVCYVGPDYTHGGKTAAGLLSMMNNQKELNILVVTGSFNIKGHNERIKGFTQGLQDHQMEYRILCLEESLDDDEHAFDLTCECLNTYQQINCIFIAAGGVKGVCDAIMHLNKQDHIRVLSFDDIPTTKALVQQGIISFTLCQEPLQQGYLAIQKLFTYLMNEGKIPLEDTITKTIIKIPENIEDQ